MMLRSAAPLAAGGGVVGELHPWQKTRVCMTQTVQLQLPKFRRQDLQSSCLQTKSPRKRRIRAVLESNSVPATDDSEASSSVQKPLAVSVIIPVYNEVATIGTLVEKVGTVMQKRGGPYEVVCIDDGSTDGTTRLLKAIAAEREDMRVIVFRRNFGQTAAMAAGFDLAAGQVFVTMDGDLQNDAEDIPQLIDQLVYGNQGGQAVHTGVVREDGGYDLVCGWRRKRKDNLLTRNFPSWVANMLIGALTGLDAREATRLWLQSQGVPCLTLVEHPPLRRNASLHPCASCHGRSCNLRTRGAPSPTNTGEVQVRTGPRFSSTDRPDYHMLLATVSGEANAFDGVSWRLVCDGIHGCSGVYNLVACKYGSDMGVRHGHCKCRPRVCVLRAASHHGFPAGVLGAISRSVCADLFRVSAPTCVSYQRSRYVGNKMTA